MDIAHASGADLNNDLNWEVAESTPINHNNKHRREPHIG
jgi:hypothetical protein